MVHISLALAQLVAQALYLQPKRERSVVGQALACSLWYHSVAPLWKALCSILLCSGSWPLPLSKLFLTSIFFSLKTCEDILSFAPWAHAANEGVVAAPSATLQSSLASFWPRSPYQCQLSSMKLIKTMGKLLSNLLANICLWMMGIGVLLTELRRTICILVRNTSKFVSSWGCYHMH